MVIMVGDKLTLFFVAAARMWCDSIANENKVDNLAVRFIPDILL